MTSRLIILLQVEKDHFWVYLEGYLNTYSGGGAQFEIRDASKYEWRIYWTAAGFNC